MHKNLKIAIVHDFISERGGAEKVLLFLSEIFPNAPIYTLFYDKKGSDDPFRGKDIRTSSLQEKPKILRNIFKVFMPVYIETLDLRDFDLIISSSGAWSKGIVTKLNTLHISYLHSPMRFVWDYNERYLREAGREKGLFRRLVLNYFRIWDREAADRPEVLIANSLYTQERVRKYYARESSLIYPPAFLSVDFKKIKESKREYFLVVSRLSPYKRIDLIVEAFNKLGLPLVVVGEGKQKKYLQKIASSNVKILGWQSPEKLEEIYLGARCFVLASDEDFGMVTVEAMSHGVPVVAYKKGGSLEIIEEELNGIFFESQTVESIADGIRRFIEKEDGFNKEKIVEKAGDFSNDKFEKKIKKEIENLLEKNGISRKFK